MLLAQAITISEIPDWTLAAFVVALIVGLTLIVRWILTHPTPE